MNKFDRFITEELMLLKWALYIVIDENEDGAYCNDRDYEIAKPLYDSIKEHLKEKKND